MTRLLLATSNSGKVAELRVLLASHPNLTDLTLVTPREWNTPLPDVEETGTTFAENARLKATALACASGLVALADDSGLCVDALGGNPGVRSARWAGPTDTDRNRALLERLRGVPDAKRTAHFTCAVCVATPDGRMAEAEGTCEGVVTDAPRGHGGFGYDPLFLMPEIGLTLAELSSGLKDQISHRARALAALAPHLAQLLGTMHRESP